MLSSMPYPARSTSYTVKQFRIFKRLRWSHFIVLLYRNELNWFMVVCFAVIVCGDPGTPDHGSKVVHRGFYYGGSIEFMCNTAYELKGSQRIYCMKSGSWSNSKPLCLGKAKV